MAQFGMAPNIKEVLTLLYTGTAVSPHACVTARGSALTSPRCVQNHSARMEFALEPTIDDGLVKVEWEDIVSFLAYNIAAYGRDCQHSDTYPDTEPSCKCSTDPDFPDTDCKA